VQRYLNLNATGDALLDSSRAHSTPNASQQPTPLTLSARNNTCHTRFTASNHIKEELI
jgi:hypothetical protein